MSVDVEAARKTLKTIAEIESKLGRPAYFTEYSMAISNLIEVSPALLAEVGALRDLTRSQNQDIRTANKEAEDACCRETEVRERLAKAEGALTDIDTAIENPLMLDKRIAQVEAILALWREEGKGDGKQS